MGPPSAATCRQIRRCRRGERRLLVWSWLWLWSSSPSALCARDSARAAARDGGRDVERDCFARLGQGGGPASRARALSLARSPARRGASLLPTPASALVMDALLNSIASLAPPDSLARIQRGGTTAAALLEELPAIHAALRAAPEAELASIMANAEASAAGGALPLPLIVRGFLAAETSDVALLASSGSNADQLREPETLGAVHRVISSLPADVKTEVTPLLQPAARPLVSLATDMDTPDFIEMASSVVDSLEPTAAATAVTQHSSYAPVTEDVEPEVVLVSRGGAAPAAPPPPTTASTNPPAMDSSSSCSAACDSALSALLSDPKISPALTILKSQGKLQMAFVQSAAVNGDPRALSLAASALAFACGLLGTLGHIGTLQPAAATLSIALICVRVASTCFLMRRARQPPVLPALRSRGSPAFEVQMVVPYSSSSPAGLVSFLAPPSSASSAFLYYRSPPHTRSHTRSPHRHCAHSVPASATTVQRRQMHWQRPINSVRRILHVRVSSNRPL